MDKLDQIEERITEEENMKTATKYDLMVACPQCKAPAGQACKEPKGAWAQDKSYKGKIHGARRRATQEIA